MYLKAYDILLTFPIPEKHRSRFQKCLCLRLLSSFVHSITSQASDLRMCLYSEKQPWTVDAGCPWDVVEGAMWQKELCTCFLSPEVAGRLENLACRINLLSWKALAWLGLAQFNSNLNTDSALHKQLFYKKGLISQSFIQSGAFRLNRDNYIHYRQPWLSIQRRILFQFIISQSSDFISLH